jgi:hypothetical protein
MNYEARLQTYREVIASQVEHETQRKRVEKREFPLHREVLDQLEIPQIFEDIKNGLWQSGEIEITQESNTNRDNNGKYISSDIKTTITLRKSWPVRREKAVYHDIHGFEEIQEGIRDIFIRGTLSSNISFDFNNKDDHHNRPSSFDFQIESNMTNSYPYGKKDPLTIKNPSPSYSISEEVLLYIISEAEGLRTQFKYPLQEQIQEDSQRIFPATY